MQVFTPSKHSPETDNNTVLILRDAQAGDKVSDGGIFIPGRAVEIASQGEVRAAVEGSQYSVGQRIVFVKYSGADITLNGIEYTLLKEKEIQGTIREVISPNDAKIESSVDLAAALQEFEDKAVQTGLASLEKEANR